MNNVNDRINLSPDVSDVTTWVDGLLTLDEAARALRISPRTLRRYVKDGTVPRQLFSRVGGRRNGAFRFSVEQIREIASTVWTTPRDEPVPPQRQPTGMVPYTPRRRV